MVEELLDFARIESGRMKLEIETFDMSIELYEAVYMYENLLKRAESACCTTKMWMQTTTSTAIATA